MRNGDDVIRTMLFGGRPINYSDFRTIVAFTALASNHGKRKKPMWRPLKNVLL